MERRTTTLNLTDRLARANANQELLEQGVEAAYLFPSIDLSRRTSVVEMPVDEDMWLGGESYAPQMKHLYKCNNR